MPKYVIERNMPGAGALSRDELAAIADKSCRALEEIGSHIQWVESFVTADKVYSIYIARDQRLIREHAYLSGFPADTSARSRRSLILQPPARRAGPKNTTWRKSRGSTEAGRRIRSLRGLGRSTIAGMRRGHAFLPP